MPSAITFAAIMIDDLVHHADRRDHRVEREHDVDDHDLGDDRRQRVRGPRRATRFVFALELVVDLVRRLADQEQAADDQDQLAPETRPCRKR